MKKTILKVTLNIADKLKPTLVKIIPMKVLQATRNKLIFQYSKNENNERLPFEKTVYDMGINLIGPIKAETGLGQSCRLLSGAILKTKYKRAIYNTKVSKVISQNDFEFDEELTDTIKYNINLLHINPSHLQEEMIELKRCFFDRRYNIGYWLWELEQFPEEWIHCFKYVDEVWTPAEFISETLRKHTDKPVKTIPYAIKVETSKAYCRKYFNIPEDKFLFLTMFDSNSVAERKNPIGAIKAFKQAFTPEDKDIALIIKVNNPKKEDIKKINDILEGYTNIIIINKILSKTEVNSLIQISDALVSLHRAEGYGLPIAEAMLLGTPTIATNWSANTEFCGEDRNCLVDYKMVEIEKDIGPYKKGNWWAEPDINHAADYMVKLKSDKEYYNNIKINAQNYIKTELNEDKIARLIEKRIDQIMEEN